MSASSPPFSRDVSPILDGRWRREEGQQATKQPEEIHRTSSDLTKRDGLIPSSTARKRPYDELAPTLYLESGKKGATLHTVASAGHYLRLSLDLRRLHDVQRWLWLAGLPLPARSLHRQRMMGRDIVVTEQSDLHLTWRESTLFLKPLWKPLLDYGFWEEVICDADGDEDARLSATGLLLSYVWLICSKTDLHIAKQHKLVPKKLKWIDWAALSRDFLSKHHHAEPHIRRHHHHHHHPFSRVADRYEYGELRLFRLNLIYRFAPGMFPDYLFRGYLYGYNRFSQFFGRNFAWAAGAVLYASVVLAAMQVALGVSAIKDHPSFQGAAYVFSVFTMVAMVFFSAAALGYFVVVFTLNLVYTRNRVKIHERLKGQEGRTSEATY
ncbi:hypothetical protein CP532_1158 [Ophiocordyceps camponoti-leonardi (nom. inval.)]|nr:hypothetical protein CP532_1158 [Ophiocordyceps camponoti-leonardi (nom. inval.)]